MKLYHLGPRSSVLINVEDCLDLLNFMFNGALMFHRPYLQIAREGLWRGKEAISPLGFYRVRDLITSQMSSGFRILSRGDIKRPY
jgi:hypothetical protein